MNLQVGFGASVLGAWGMFRGLCGRGSLVVGRFLHRVLAHQDQTKAPLKEPLILGPYTVVPLWIPYSSPYRFIDRFGAFSFGLTRCAFEASSCSCLQPQTPQNPSPEELGPHGGSHYGISATVYPKGAHASAEQVLALK